MWWNTLFLYKMFWNSIGVVQCQAVSQKVCSDKGFVIWHFVFVFFQQIVSLWSLSIWIRIIFKYRSISEPDNTLKSNGPWTRFLYDKECATDKTYVRKCAAGNILLTESWWVLCPLDAERDHVVYWKTKRKTNDDLQYAVCKSFFSNHRSESFFNQFID